MYPVQYVHKKSNLLPQSLCFRLEPKFVEHVQTLRSLTSVARRAGVQVEKVALVVMVRGDVDAHVLSDSVSAVGEHTSGVGRLDGNAVIGRAVQAE